MHIKLDFLKINSFVFMHQCGIVHISIVMHLKNKYISQLYQGVASILMLMHSSEAGSVATI